MIKHSDPTESRLTHAQQELLFTIQTGSPEASAAFHVAAGLMIQAALEPGHVQASWLRLCDESGLFRLSVSPDGSSLQAGAVDAFPWTVHDWQDKDEAERSRLSRELIERETATPFELHQAPILRCHLMRLSPQSHYLVVVSHELVCSQSILELMLADLARSLQGKGANPSGSPAEGAAPGPVPAHAMAQALEHWSKALEGCAEALDIPSDLARPAERSYAIDQVNLSLPAPLAAGIRSLAATGGYTPGQVILAAFACFLSRLAGQAEFCLASALGASPYLPLPVRVKRESSFRDNLTALANALEAGSSHPAFSMGELLQRLQVPRDPSRVPLVPLAFRAAALGHPGIQAVPRWYDPFELGLQALERDGDIQLILSFNVALFLPATTKRWLSDFCALLQGAVDQPACPVQDLPILCAESRALLFDAWNRTDLPLPAEQTALAMIEAQVRRSPDAVAVRDPRTTWTYRELDHRANHLAARLLACGVKPGTMVGVCQDRSVEMVASLLAIWKCGAAYVPLDPDFPRPRLAYIAQNAAITVLLTERPLADILSDPALQRIWVDEEAGSSENSPGIAGAAGDLAYVLHTSGSTGQPKGVQIEQGNLVNFLLSMGRDIPLSPGDVLVAVTTLSFDIAGLELFLPLSRGASTVIATREDILDGQRLAGLLKQSKASLLQATPATWQLLVDAEWQAPPGFTALCGGEAFPRDLARKLTQRCAKVWNVYGPTETTIWSTLDLVSSGESAISIGRPMANTSLYLVDERLQAVPIGAIGELLIGGLGVGRGYLNRPDLSAERFIPDPFSARPGARVYRTGDLCRYGADGRVFFERRNDSQVKVRGFRIELGEIETAIGDFAGVQQAVVLVREFGHGDLRIAAYLVAQAGQSVNQQSLRDYLANRLPPYMIPQYFVNLERFPLTPNGKIDRKALPMPAQEEAEEAAVVPPATPLEKQLLEIWKTLLKTPRISVEDSFFDLGGHSVLAARMILRIRESMGTELPMRTVFHALSIRKIAVAIEEARCNPANAAALRIPRVADQDHYLATPTQVHNFYAAEHGPGLPAAWSLSGPLQANALSGALGQVLSRHKVLHSRFERHGDHIQATLVPPSLPELVFEDLAGLPENERNEALRQQLEALSSAPFDIAHGPLFRFALFRLGAERHVFAAVFSQLVFDGASLPVFLDELSMAYAAQANGQEWHPLPLPLQFPDYAAWNAATLSRVVDAQAAWWRQALGEEITGAPIPVDLKRPSVPSHRGGQLSFTIPDALSSAIRERARSLGTTPQLFFLSGLMVLVNALSGRSECLVATPMAGRRHPELERLLGSYINLILIKAELKPAMAVADLITQVKDFWLAAYDQQDIPLDEIGLRVRQPDPETMVPLCQIEFSYEQHPATRQNFGPLGIEVIPLHSGGSANELTLWLQDDGLLIRGGIEFATELFLPDTIGHWLICYEQILAAMAQDITAPIEKINVVGPEASRIKSTIYRALAAPPAWLPTGSLRRPETVRLVDPQGRQVPLGVYGILKAGDQTVMKDVRVTCAGHWERYSQPAKHHRPRVHGRNQVVDPVEFHILELFQSVLHIKQVQLHDNFFELGGHSSLAVQILNGVNREFGASLALAVLFKAPTPFELARVVRSVCHLPDPETGLVDKRWIPEVSTIVPIQAHGSLPPFFVAAGVGGNPMNLRFIAKHLGHEQPFYGLQHRGTDGRHKPHRRVGDMAREYAQDIRSLQKSGPYFLGGFSAGGIAMFEVARELMAQGEQVAILVMFDALSPLAKRKSGQAAAAAAPGTAGVPASEARPRRSYSLFRRVLNRLSRYRERSFIFIGAQLARIAPYPFRNEAVTHAWYQAEKQYQPTTLKVDITVLRSQVQDQGYDSPDNGWAALTTGRLELIEVAGDHNSHIESPYIEKNAPIIAQALAQARDRHHIP